MQVSQQSRMGEAQKNRAGYICGYVGGNEVGEKGCRHLSKATWGQFLSHSNLKKTLLIPFPPPQTGSLGHY